MKQSSLFSFLTVTLSAILWTACGNSSSTPTTAAGNATTTPTATPAAAGGGANGSFSAVFDGIPVSGTGTDQPLQQLNSAFVYDSDSGQTKLLIDLCTWKNPDEGKFTHSIRFWAPNETGTWTIDENSPLHNKYSLYLDVDTGSMSRFTMGTFTLTITSVNGTHVTGTFSAHLTLSNDTPRGPKKSMDVTDGKFDVPIATSKVRPV